MAGLEGNRAVSTTEEPSSRAVAPELVRRLAEKARDQGLDLVGQGGLLRSLTKQVLKTGLPSALRDPGRFRAYVVEVNERV
jgi:putative transposase